MSKRLVELQELHYARRERALLVIFQALDAGGKDSTTRRVFRNLDPAAMRVKSFKRPTERERYYEALCSVDDSVGAVLEQLKKMGIVMKRW